MLYELDMAPMTRQFQQWWVAAGMHLDRQVDLEEIRTRCLKVSDRGHFASVSIMSATEAGAGESYGSSRLLRGHGMTVRFEGLKPLRATA